MLVSDVWDFEDEYPIKKANRHRKIDKREQANEDFQRVNGLGLKKVILPLIGKKAKEAREKRENE